MNKYRVVIRPVDPAPKWFKKYRTFFDWELQELHTQGEKTYWSTGISDPSGAGYYWLGDTRGYTKTEQQAQEKAQALVDLLQKMRNEYEAKQVKIKRIDLKTKRIELT